MSEMVIGTSALPGADVPRIRQAHIGWVRQGFRFPFVDRLGGEISEDYRKARAQAEAWRAAGLKVMGVSPLPVSSRWEPDAGGTLRLKWTPRLPEWCGPLGSEQYVRTYQATCEWLAADLKGIVSMWQIANELDIEMFAGPLTPRQACELIAAGARGLKAADPSLLVGHNPAGAPKAYFLFGRLYGCGDGLLDYCGVDGYYGTWAPGSPGDWAGRIAELHELTGTKVLVNEWGFASRGDVAAHGEAPGVANCQLRKWRHTWGPGHTPEGQGAFVREAFDAFRSRRDALLGVFFYRWEDQARCWQCGSPDCPVETAWGLVDLEGRPKPSFEVFREGVERLSA
ncbi:MAG TPA: hypothetical protein VM389_00585 [Phycisphaerae bacterium]|nr:hypothetical protein [Phycisphaerae bacterium]HUU21004.1 hypothetical protein [Phycisphaerae bacterium]